MERFLLAGFADYARHRTEQYRLYHLVWQTAGKRAKQLFADDGDGRAHRGVLSVTLLFCQRHRLYLRAGADDDCRRAGDAGHPLTGVLPDGRRRHWSGQHSHPLCDRPKPHLLR